MSSNTAQVAPDARASTGSAELPSLMPLLSGLVAGGVACGIPFIQGLVTGWQPVQAVIYVLVSLVYILLTIAPILPLRLARWLCQTTWAYLLVGGLVGLTLQAISGDSFVQPIVFTVLFVHGAIAYNTSQARIVAVGLFYLGLMALGQWLHGWRDADLLVYPVVAYGALLGFMYAFTQMSVAQLAARQQADALAADLERERDYLARLVEITGALTRDLDLLAVLELVASEGRTLAQAGQARVWLRASPTDAEPERLQLAAAVPPEATPQLAESEQQALLVTNPVCTGSMLVLPLLFRGENIGALELCERPDAPFTSQDVRLLQPFADAAAVAIHNARLYAQSRLSATLHERNRIARELHDTIAQGLTAISMQLEAAQRSFERDSARTRTRVTRAAELTHETLDDVRRSVWLLGSPLLDGSTLVDALADVATRFEQRTGITTIFQHQGPAPSLDPTAASEIVRIVQEALHNIEKHAQASSVTVTTVNDTDALRVEIGDNGVGFAQDQQRGLNASGGFGLTSIRERARLIGGVLTIDSAPGQGTRIHVTIAE